MPADESDPPNQSYLDKIKAMYPDEFHDKPITLKQQLKEMDQIIAVEEHYLDNPDSLIDSPVTLDEVVEKRRTNYRDNKKWLEDEG